MGWRVRARLIVWAGVGLGVRLGLGSVAESSADLAVHAQRRAEVPHAHEMVLEHHHLPRRCRPAAGGHQLPHLGLAVPRFLQKLEDHVSPLQLAAVCDADLCTGWTEGWRWRRRARVEDLPPHGRQAMACRSSAPGLDPNVENAESRVIVEEGGGGSSQPTCRHQRPHTLALALALRAYTIAVARAGMATATVCMHI